MEEITHPPGERLAENATNRGSGVTGDLRLHVFPSKVFGNSRRLRVWLPPRYEARENQGRYYAALYLNDGQNLFDPATAFNGIEWRVDETADRLIRQGSIPPLIVVGIDHAQSDRMKEFVPYRSVDPAIPIPQGKHYPAFLMREVMPFVCKRYRIAPGPENSALGGSSLGALISLYTVIARPGIFGRLLLESPSLYVSQRRILRRSQTLRHWPEKVFLAVGTREGGQENKDQQVVEDVRTLEGIIHRAGADESHLLVMVEEGAMHGESAWAKRFPQALEFLFGNNGKGQTK